jgi:hypothetical protein
VLVTVMKQRDQGSWVRVAKLGRHGSHLSHMHVSVMNLLPSADTAMASLMPSRSFICDKNRKAGHQKQPTTGQHRTILQSPRSQLPWT